MEWWLVLTIIFGSLILLMLTGLPVAFCFMLINIVGVFLYWGGQAGLEQLIYSMFASLATFALVPVPLFILMGEALFNSGLAPKMIDALDMWLGRLPGRLSLEAVGAGTIMATLTGSSYASVGMLGSSLVPEMEKRGYAKPMSLGPILGAGGLAIMIPPSAAAIVMGWLGGISIAKLLIGIIMPGLLMATIFAIYIIVRCKLNPTLAPPYVVPPTPLSERLKATAWYILPVGLVIFLVTGVIFLGIATPSEAAATGALGTFILVLMHRRLNWNVIKKSVRSTVRITAMAYIILAGAMAFSQILAFSGASQGLAASVTDLEVAPIVVLLGIQAVLILLGMFMNTWTIMMITVPIFMPVANALGFDPVWFGVLYLVNMEIGMISPPFGMSLFILKSVAPPDTTMADVMKASLPFVGLDLTAMAIVIAFPIITLWLPNMMR